MRETKSILTSGKLEEGVEDAIASLALDIAALKGSVDRQTFLQNPFTAEPTDVWSGDFAASEGVAGYRWQLISNGVDTPDDTKYITAVNTDCSDLYVVDLHETLSLGGTILRIATKAEIRIRCRRTTVGDPSLYVSLESNIGTQVISPTWVVPTLTSTWENLVLTKGDLDFTGLTEAYPSVYITVAATGNTGDTIDISEIDVSLAP